VRPADQRERRRQIEGKLLNLPHVPEFCGVDLHAGRRAFFIAGGTERARPHTRTLSRERGNRETVWREHPCQMFSTDHASSKATTTQVTLSREPRSRAVRTR